MELMKIILGNFWPKIIRNSPISLPNSKLMKMKFVRQIGNEKLGTHTKKAGISQKDFSAKFTYFLGIEKDQNPLHTHKKVLFKSKCL